MAMYGLEKWCIRLKYHLQYLREGIDGHVWFRHFIHGQRSTRINILYCCSVLYWCCFLYCIFFFLFLTSLLCSFLFLQIKEIKLNMCPLNTVLGNLIYFVLPHTFGPFSFFFATLRIFSNQAFLRFEVLVSTCFFFRLAVLNKSIGGESFVGTLVGFTTLGRLMISSSTCLLTMSSASLTNRTHRGWLAAWCAKLRNLRVIFF